MEAYLQERNQTWRTDASNLDLAYCHETDCGMSSFPNWLAQFNPSLVETLTRTVEILEGEDAWMRALDAEWLDQNGTTGEGGFTLTAESHCSRARLRLARQGAAGSVKREPVRICRMCLLNRLKPCGRC